jgi:cystathionine gamma-synthase
LPHCDVLTSSLTKWVSGAGDVLAGAATVRSDSPLAADFLAPLSEDAAECAPLYIADAEVLLSNMKGYAKRNTMVNANALALVAFLKDHPAVASVWHPSITQTENYAKIMHKKGGYGGLLSVILTNPKKAPKVYDALKLSKGPSFGTSFTLVCPYTLLAHYDELDWTEDCGVPSNLLRISVGLESPETIVNAFTEALD